MIEGDVGLRFRVRWTNEAQWRDVDMMSGMMKYGIRNECNKG